MIHQVKFLLILFVIVDKETYLALNQYTSETEKNRKNSIRIRLGSTKKYSSRLDSIRFLKILNRFDPIRSR
jgi:hypothetical protein